MRASRATPATCSSRSSRFAGCSPIPTFPTGVLAIARDYAPVAREARADFVQQAVTIAIALLLLYGASFPALRRVTRTLEARNRRLAAAGAGAADAHRAGLRRDLRHRPRRHRPRGERAGRAPDRSRAHALVGLEFADLVDPAELAVHPLGLDELSAGRTVLHERRLRLPDGSLVVGELHARMLDDGRVFASVRDVTQLRRAQRAESVGRLAGGVAHDFNNLLTGIAGYADFLVARFRPVTRCGARPRRSARRPPGAPRSRASCSSSGSRRIEQPALVDANDSLADAASLLGRLLGEDIALTVEPAPEPAPLEIDPGQLDQLFVTLALSARESMPEGGSLTLAVALKGEQDPDQRPRHRRRPRPRPRAGAARALRPPERRSRARAAFAAAFAHGSEGDARIESDASGTTVSVLLPRAEAPVVALKQPASTRGTGGSETILVVEDEELVRRRHPRDPRRRRLHRSRRPPRPAGARARRGLRRADRPARDRPRDAGARRP